MYVVSFYITLNRVQRNSEIVGGTIAWAGVPEMEGENELSSSAHCLSFLRAGAL